MKKKKNLRSTTKNSAVKPELNLKSRYEELSDINEYYGSLPPEAQEWMNKYTENYVNAGFNEDRLLTVSSTRVLLKQYIQDIKKYKGERKIKDFVSKYLIREDNVPLNIIKLIFFETDDKKLKKLTSQLKDAIMDNISNVGKREIGKIMKLMENEVYNNNNARNRCIITKSKAKGTLNYLEELDENDIVLDENDLIERIDLQKELNKLKK